MQRETETVVVDKVLESHRRSRYKFSQRFFSNSKFQVLLVAILCGLIGGSYLLVKAASTSYSLWSNSTIPRTITSSSSSSIELGVKFKSKNSGYVTAIRFYKGAQNTGTNIGSLWTAGGSLLASVTFTNETASGWQTANLTQPVNIAANVVYVVSYFAPNGHYSYNNGYFNYRRSYSNGPLTALASNNADGPNGVYINSSTPAFPTKGMGNANFWVDLVFTTKLVAAPVAPAPPTTVTAAQNGSSIVVSWNAGISSNPIASYNVLRNGTKLASVSSTTLTYTDTNLTAGNTYAYQIETVDNTNAASANSVTASATYNVTPTTVTLSASPATLTAGQSTTLTWSTSNATSCTATGSWSGSKSTSGTASTGALSTTSTYALTCTGLGGTSSASTTVTVTAGVPVVPVSTNPSGVSMPAANAYPGYTQVLADDFTGTSLNQTTWNGFYTDLSQNWLTTHGTVANNEITMSEYKDSANNGVYTGTGLSTRTGWTSGMSFVRARTDGAAGVTMCIGMIGLNTWPPEIDFYEDWPSTNTRQLFTDSIVWGAPATWESTVIRKVNTSVDATQWHTYGVEWNPTTITLLVDGVAWATVPNPSPTGANSFSQPMKLFMQIETGDVGAEPTSITPAVVNMNVDWATVYTPN
jgi:hypothetical protein